MLLMKSWCGKMSLRVGMASATVFGLLLLAACGGDSGTSAPSNDGISDSEEIQSSSSSQKLSSSSQKSSSSSSLKTISSSSKQLSSSSSDISSSSSSLKSISSSSKPLSSSSSQISTSSSSKLSSSSSSSPMVKSSSSSKDDMRYSSSKQSSSSSKDDEIDDGWSWDVPKEARLNPEIAYDSMIDPRDGQIYKTVKIGEHVWMAENLNYVDSVKTPSLLGRSWCYKYKAKNCAVAGRFYTWGAAIDSVALYDGGNGEVCGSGETCSLPAKVQGICPPGWHLPDSTEWNTLFTEVGGRSTAGKALKSRSGWNVNGNGTDAYGFSALPTGDWSLDNDLFFSDGGYEANFWSATESNCMHACFMHLFNLYEYAEVRCEDKRMSKYSYIKDSGYPIRCLKDL